MLTKDQVRKVAKLANLPITSEEEETYTKQLAKILDYVEQLEKIDTKGIEPTYNTSSNKNITREDRTSNSLTQDQALQNTSKKKDGFFVTKGVFESD